MARLSVRIRSRLFDSILAQELGYFDCTKTGARGAPAALARGWPSCKACALWPHFQHAAALAKQLIPVLLRTAGEITSRLSADTTTVSEQICLNLNVRARGGCRAVSHPPVSRAASSLCPPRQTQTPLPKSLASWAWCEQTRQTGW